MSLITSSRGRSSSSNKRPASPSENNYWSDTTANAAYTKLNEAEVAKQRAAVDTTTKLLLQPPTKKTRGSSSSSSNVEQVVAAKKPIKAAAAAAAAAVAGTKTKKPLRATAAIAVTKMNRTTKVIAVPTNQKLTKLKEKVVLALARDKKSKSTSSNVAAVKTTAVAAPKKPWKKMTLAEKVGIAVQRAAASEEKQKEEKRMKQVVKLAKRQGLKKPAGEKRSRTPRPKEFAWKVCPLGASPRHTLSHTQPDLTFTTVPLTGADWDGNSDDEGSVDSAILEESICYGCGKSTVGLAEAEWNSIIVCDVCDGEYHLQCVKLDRVPRSGNKWTCPRCQEEDQEFTKVKYIVQGDRFELPKKKKDQVISVCYSPSRPLALAFEECKNKGLMMVSRLLTYDIMRKLTHGVITKMTQSGRIADTWSGATVEMAKRINDSSHNIVDRQGRYDMKLPEFVVRELKLEEILAPILSLLDTIMVTTKKAHLRTHQVVFCPVGSEDQIWHVDDCQRKKGLPHRYFTILVHLNHIDANSGGTEIWCKDLHRGDLIRGRPGDAFVFPGSLLHRGRGNDGHTHRFFYYASYAVDMDGNTEDI